MRIISMSETECKALLKRVMIGRLASSLKDQPYVVPICFSYIPGKNCLYLFSTVGQKIKWMRKNPKVCFQADEIGSRAIWASVVVNGKYVELKEPKFTAEKQQAIEYLPNIQVGGGPRCRNVVRKPKIWKLSRYFFASIFHRFPACAHR